MEETDWGKVLILVDAGVRGPGNRGKCMEVIEGQAAKNLNRANLNERERKPT